MARKKKHPSNREERMLLNARKEEKRKQIKGKTHGTPASKDGDIRELVE